MSQIRTIAALIASTACIRAGCVPFDGGVESTIAKNSILPVALTTDLTSAVAHVGDKFTARILTHGTDRYAGLPFGSVIYGTVKYVKRLEGESAGLLELNFDGIETPSGARFPISGLLVEFEVKSVPKDKLYAGNLPTVHQALFAGYGTRSRLIVGLKSATSIKDADIPKVVAKTVPAATRNAFSGEVQLPADSKFGVQLLKPLAFPKDVM